MLNWLQRLMYGRYGTDQLNLFLLVFSIVASLILRFTPVWYLGYLTYLPLGYAVFRMFSRNHFQTPGGKPDLSPPDRAGNQLVPHPFGTG